MRSNAALTVRRLHRDGCQCLWEVLEEPTGYRFTSSGIGSDGTWRSSIGIGGFAEVIDALRFAPDMILLSADEVIEFVVDPAALSPVDLVRELRCDWRDSATPEGWSSPVVERCVVARGSEPQIVGVTDWISRWATINFDPIACAVLEPGGDLAAIPVLLDEDGLPRGATVMHTWWSNYTGMPSWEGGFELRDLGNDCFLSLPLGDSCEMGEEPALLWASSNVSREELIAGWRRGHC